MAIGNCNDGLGNNNKMPHNSSLRIKVNRSHHSTPTLYLVYNQPTLDTISGVRKISCGNEKGGRKKISKQEYNKLYPPVNT